jgi:hypothetical protein
MRPPRPTTPLTDAGVDVDVDGDVESNLVA